MKAALLAGTYRPAPVKRGEILKPGGGLLLPGFPTVMDRFLQHACIQVINPVFNAKFSWHSFSFRPGKSSHDAVKQAQRYIKSVRYADDCTIFVVRQRGGEHVIGSVNRFVEGKLKLKVNREKSTVARSWHRKFLGFSFLARNRGVFESQRRVSKYVKREFES